LQRYAEALKAFEKAMELGDETARQTLEIMRVE